MESERLIACVLNVCEGRRQATIDAIKEAIVENVEHVRLLGPVESSKCTNRTEFTIVGPPSAVVEVALAAAKVIAKLVDMSQTRKGKHERLGALDVCPFIPVGKGTMEDAKRCATEFSKRLSADLGVPVYCYEESAVKGKHRKTVTQIRKGLGEYEGLEEKIKEAAWAPDYGPAEFRPKWGATVCGARPELITFNVNLYSTTEQAHCIAKEIGERSQGEQNGGGLRNVRALGCSKNPQHAQVLTYLTDYKVTGLAQVYEEINRQAKVHKVMCSGSQIVGSVPLQALLDAAEFYIQKESTFILEESDKIGVAISKLGLNSAGQFEPEKRIIEYALGLNVSGHHGSSPVVKFVRDMGSRTVTPGGGCACALAAAMGAALGTMDGRFMCGKGKEEEIDTTMRQAFTPLHTTMNHLLKLIDADALAFKTFKNLPKATTKDKEREKVQATHEIIDVPLDIMRTISQCWHHLEVIARCSDLERRSDLLNGTRLLECGVLGAFDILEINLAKLSEDDKEYREKVSTEARRLCEEAQTQCRTILEIVKSRQRDTSHAVVVISHSPN